MAFNFFMVTTVLTFSVNTDPWTTTLYLILVKHASDFIANTLDLIGFTTRDLELASYRLGFDIISLILAFTCLLNFQRYYNTGPASALSIQTWLWCELGLMAVNLLVYGLLRSVMTYTVNSADFQQTYYRSLRGQDDQEDQDFKRQFLS